MSEEPLLNHIDKPKILKLNHQAHSDRCVCVCVFEICDRFSFIIHHSIPIHATHTHTLHSKFYVTDLNGDEYVITACRKEHLRVMYGSVLPGRKVCVCE
jgi:hypothetical protein